MRENDPRSSERTTDRPDASASPSGKKSEAERPNTGLCSEAQADGVPCYETGRQCEECDRARDRSER